MRNAAALFITGECLRISMQSLPSVYPSLIYCSLIKLCGYKCTHHMNRFSVQVEMNGFGRLCKTNKCNAICVIRNGFGFVLTMMH